MVESKASHYSGDPRKQQDSYSQAARQGAGMFRRRRLTDVDQITRVTSVPKSPDTVHASEDQRAKKSDIEEILRMQYRNRTPVFVVWNRGEQNGNVDFITGGIPSIEDETSGQSILLYPAGAEGKKFVDPQILEAELTTQYPYWVKLIGVPSNFIPAESSKQKTAERSLAELFNLYSGSAAVVVQGIPSDPEKVVQMTQGKNKDAKAAALAAAARQNDEELSSNAERLKREHKDLQKAQDWGHWESINCMAGAKTLKELQLLSSLVAAYIDVGEASIIMEPVWKTEPTRTGVTQKRPYSFTEALEDTQAVFSGNTELLARLASPPKQEIPGVIQKETHRFSVNYERSEIGDTREIPIGRIVDQYGRTLEQELRLTAQDLLEGVGIFGLPGAGKTGLVTQIVEEVSRQDNPVHCIAIVTTKPEEMAAVAGRIDEPVYMLPVGSLEDTQAGINLFKPLNWNQLDGHLRRLHAAFMAGYLGEPEALRLFSDYVNYGLYGDPEHFIPGIHQQLGWDIVLGEPLAGSAIPPSPQMKDFRSTVLEIKEEMKFAAELNNMGPFLNESTRKFRQGLLGRFLERAYQIDVNQLFENNTIIDLSRIKNKKEQSFIAMVLFMFMDEYDEAQADKRGKDAADRPLEHLLIIDEAQNMLPKVASDEQNAVIDAIVTSMRERRKRGFGYVLAAQQPNLLHPTALALPGTRVAFRMTEKADYELVAGGMMLGDPADKRREKIASLRRGRALLYNQNTPGDPVMFQTPNPASKSQRTDRVLPVDRLIEKSAWIGYHGKEFATSLPSVRERQRVEQILDRTQEGLNIQSLAELLTMARLLGLGDVRLRPELIENIYTRVHRDYSGKPGFTPESGRRMIGHAIREAVGDAIDPRVQEILTYLPDPSDRPLETLIDNITLDMYNSIFGEQAEESLGRKGNNAFSFFRDQSVHTRLFIANLGRDMPNLDLGEMFGDNYKGVTAKQAYERMKEEEMQKGNTLGIDFIEELAFRTVLSPLSDDRPPEWKDYKLRIEALTGVAVEEKGVSAIEMNNRGELEVRDPLVGGFVMLLENFTMGKRTRDVLIRTMERMVSKYRQQIKEEDRRNEQLRSQQPDMRSAAAAEEQAASLEEIKSMAQRYYLGLSKDSNIQYD